MKLIQTLEIGSGAGGVSSVTFDAIPQNANHLIIMGSLRSTSANTDVFLLLNGLNTGFSGGQISASGSGVGGGAITTGLVGQINPSSSTASTFATFILEITNYSAAVNKDIQSKVSQGNYAATGLVFHAGQGWANTSPVTSLTLTATNFAEYSTFSLYTITNP